jgi:hypothetical protein
VATVPIQLTSRSFDRQHVDWLLGALAHIKAVFSVRRAAAYQLDVMLLLHNLWRDTRDFPEARRATRECVLDLTNKLGEHGEVSSRLWLVDGQAADGRVFTIDDVSPVLKQFDPQRLPPILQVRRTETSVYSFGARSVWFPRTQVLEYLGTRCVEKFFENEMWVDGATIPQATVAAECADFIQQDVQPITTRMGYERGTTQLIVPQLTPPAIDGGRPAASTLDEIRKTVDDLERSQLEGVQRRLVENRKAAVDELKAAVRRRVDRQLDDRAERARLALAFLENLTRTSGPSGPSAGGDRIEMARPWTLRQAFAKEFQFFDNVVGYDTTLRERVTQLQLRLDECLLNLETLLADKSMTQKSIAQGDVAADGDLEAVDKAIEMCGQEIESLREQVLEARRAVKEQDLAIVANREEFGRRLEARTETAVSTAEARVNEQAKKTDEAHDAFELAEKAWKAKSSLGAGALVLLAAVLIAIGFVVAWLVPPLFHVGERSAYLWLIDTSVGWWLFNIWVVATLVLVLLAAFGDRSTRKELKAALDQCRARYDDATRALAQELMGYWAAYSKRFTDKCEWTRCLHVFDTNRELEVFIDGLHDELDAFVRDLQGARASAQQRARDFQLSGTLTEDIVVDMDYVEALHAAQSTRTDQFAREFLEEDAHRLSQYFPGRAEALTSAIRKACAAKVFGDVEHTSVIKAMNEGATFDVARAAGALAVFLPLKLATRVDTVLVVQGPGPEEALAGTVERLAPAPFLIISDDDERMLLLRIAHDVDLRNVTVLMEEHEGPRSRSVD